MKKLYCKPEVHYESFDLMDAIASCTLTATQGDPATCTYYDSSWNPGMTLFATGVNENCTAPMEFFEAMAGAVFGS